MREKDIKFSIIVPVYNSEKTLVKLFERIKTTFNKENLTFEVIFVEDCGTDKSWKVLEELKKNYWNENITIVKLSKNFGQHNALLCGFQLIKGSFAVTIDDDLQIPPEEIPKLIDKQQLTNADIVYGVYAKKKHSFIRNVGSYFVKRLFEYGSATHKGGSSFRLMTHDLVKKISRHTQHFVFIDNVISWHTRDIDFVTVKHEARSEGSSGYSFFKLVVITLSLIINYTVIPLRLMTYGGLMASFISFCIGIYFLYQKIFYGLMLGFASVIVSIFFGTSLILFCLGIIGEYIRRIYVEQSQMPQYSIKQIVE
ncbi:MAG: glycosyltransferase family 2 protein [Chitinophagales bacterium]